ncbi:cyclic Di-GMP phosphodiesterase RmdB [soil metagenome]
MMRRVVGGLQIVTLLALLADLVSAGLRSANGGGYSPFFDAWLYNVISMACAVLCLTRPMLVREERAAWTMLGTGLTLYGLGNVYWSAFLRQLAAPPFPSIADFLWLSFYPCAIVGLFLLVRKRVAGFPLTLALDGLIGGLGAAALGAAVVFGPVLATMGGSVSTIATILAYPSGDLLLLAFVIGVFTLLGARGGGDWWLLATGLIVFAVADSLYTIQLATTTDVEGSLLYPAWGVGMFLIAAAACRRPRRAARPDVAGWAVLAIPTTLALTALSLLVYGHFVPLPTLSIVLAAATLLATMARAALTFREVRALADSRRQALTDELTGLANRRSFSERVTVELANRTGSGSAAILLIDLDRFKEINDTLGHHVGDELLQQIGPRLGSALRPDDRLARLGGDEFAAFLKEADLLQAATVAERVAASLVTTFTVGGVALHIDASIGITLFPDHADDTQTLMRNADVAMYRAKRARTGVEIYDPARDGRDRSRLQTVEQLRTAVEEGQLVLHYQPKCSLQSGEVVGVEALLRWNHPTRGLLYPDAFLPLAEETGVMRPLTSAVLRMALHQARVWWDSGMRLSVAVNLSPSDLMDCYLPREVEQVLAEEGLPPQAIEVELTEDVIMMEPVRAREVISDLRRSGVSVSIDDYGTGYSSLAYLRDLPVDTLKLDRSFVSGLTGQVELAAIVRSTVELAHSLNLRLVAEGVERADEWRYLAGIGCDIAQGYLMCRPAAAEAMTAWLMAADHAYLEAARQAGLDASFS